MPDTTNQYLPAKAPRFAINRHFRLESLIMISFVVAFLIFGLAVGIAGPWVMGYLEAHP